MRKFQRVAVVAAAVAGISFLGAGVSSAAGGEDAPPQITAVANSTANAVATGGDYLYNMPATQPEMQPQAQPEEQQAQPEAQPQVQGNAGPEQGGYEQNQGDQ